MLDRELIELGVAPGAARALEAAVVRSCGLLVVCGPAGAGKTALGEVLARYPYPRASMLGDLRMPDEITAGLNQAERAVVVAVVRSGESAGLSLRWRDMGIPQVLIERASLMTATLRRLPRANPGAAVETDLLVVEVLGPDGTLLTGSLVDEAKGLVAAGLVTEESARFQVPGYEARTSSGTTTA